MAFNHLTIVFTCFQRNQMEMDMLSRMERKRMELAMEMGLKKDNSIVRVRKDELLS